MRAFATAGVALNLALAGLFVALRLLGDDERPRTGADWLAESALLGVWLLPALVALAGRREPGPLLAAAGLAVLAAWTSFSVTLALLLCAVLYVLGAVRPEAERLAGRALVAVVAVLALGVGARAAAFSDTEEVCWEYVVRADGTTSSRIVAASDARATPVLGGALVEAGGGCEDRPTVPASLATLFLAAGAVGLAASRRAVRDA